MEIPSFVENLSIGGILALVFYLTVKHVILNNREIINKLLEENRRQREACEEMIGNHLTSAKEADQKLAQTISAMSKEVSAMPKVIVDALRKKKR